MSRSVRPRQEWGRGRNTRMGGSDPTFGRLPAAQNIVGSLPPAPNCSGPCFGRVQESDSSSCNAGCNGARIAKGGGTLGTSESTVEATQDNNPSGPPGGRSQKHPKRDPAIPHRHFSYHLKEGVQPVVHKEARV